MIEVNKKGFLFFFVFSLSTLHFPSFTFCAAKIHSPAAVVIDASTGRILYAKNPNLRLPPASIAKLMTAIVAMEEVKLTDTAVITKNATGVSPSKAGFKEGDRVNVETLLYAALLESANDATVALAEAVAGSEKKFAHLMNKKAAAIGLKNTKFINSSGLPGHGQYTTAYDISRMMKYALRYPTLKEIIGTPAVEVSTEGGSSFFLRNTNRLLLSNKDIIGGKTGYTRKARHCIVCAAKRNGSTVIVAILGALKRSYMWKDAETLIDKGFNILAGQEKHVVYSTKPKKKTKSKLAKRWI